MEALSDASGAYLPAPAPFGPGWPFLKEPVWPYNPWQETGHHRIKGKA